MKFAQIGLVCLQCMFAFADEIIDHPSDVLFKTEFNNGINVILCEDFKMPVAIVGIIFDIGEVDNPIGNYAMTKLVADNLVSKELNDQLLLIGASYTISVTDRYTEIRFILPPKHLKNFFNFIFDGLRNIKIQNIRATRKTVAMQEILKASHFHSAISDNAFSNILLGGKRVELIFNRREMEKIDESAVKNFFFDHYIDCNLTIIVAGAVGRKKLIKVLHSSMGKFPKRKKIRDLKHLSGDYKEVFISNKFLSNSLHYIYKVPKEFNTSFLNAFLFIFNYEMFNYLRKWNYVVDQIGIAEILNQKDSLLCVSLLPRAYIPFEKVQNAYTYVINFMLKQKFSSEYFAKIASLKRLEDIMRYNDLSAKYDCLRNAYLSFKGTRRIFDVFEQIKDSNEEVIKSYALEILKNNFIMQIKTQNRAH